MMGTRWRVAYPHVAATLALVLAIAGGFAATASTGPKVFAGFHDADIPAQDDLTTPITSLKVPAGNYAIVGKAELFDNENLTVNVTCKLAAGADFDISGVLLEGNSGVVVNDATLPFALVHKFRKPGRIKLFCDGSGVDIDVSNIKIVATRVGRIKNVEI